MRSLIVVVLTLTVFTAAGCSGDDDADPTTTRDPTTTVVVTSEPDATVPPTIERSTTTSAPTTAAPTTTIDPTEALIADIEADLNAGEQAFLAAGADPSSPELREEVARYYGGTSLAVATNFLDQLVADGLLVKSVPDLPSFVQVMSLESSNGDEPTEATVVLCRVDAGVVYEPLGDLGDAIVNDEIYNTVSSNTILFVDGVWKLNGGTTVEERSGVSSCDS